MIIRTISYSRECFINVIDALKWMDSLFADVNLSPDKKSAYAFVQANLDDLRNKPQSAIRTWVKHGMIFASSGDIKNWLEQALRREILSQDERAALVTIKDKIESAERMAVECLPDDETSGNAPFQMFMDFMDKGLIKLCCRWQLMVDSTVDGKNLFLAYLPGKIRIPIKNKKDIRSAIKTAVAMIAADENAPHHFAARLALEMDARSEMADKKKAGHTLDEAAFDRIGGPFGTDIDFGNAI